MDSAKRFLENSVDIRKCDTQAEVALCRSLGLHSSPTEKWGVIEKEGFELYVYFDASGLFRKSENVLKAYHQKATDAAGGELSRIAAALFITTAMSGDIPFSELEKYKLYAGLYDSSDGSKLRTVLSVKVSVLQNLKVFMNEKRVLAIQEHGLKVLDFSDEYYLSKSFD